MTVVHNPSSCCQGCAACHPWATPSSLTVEVTGVAGGECGDCGGWNTSFELIRCSDCRYEFLWEGAACGKDEEEPCGQVVADITSVGDQLGLRVNLSPRCLGCEPDSGEIFSKTLSMVATPSDCVEEIGSALTLDIDLFSHALSSNPWRDGFGGPFLCDWENAVVKVTANA